MIQRSIIIFVLAVRIRSNVGVDWCAKNLECNTRSGPIKNTMCTYKPLTKTDQCSDIADAQTPDTRKIMLNLHNEYRNKLAGGEMTGWPKAANMREMTWDDEVESVALRWAVQCVDGHDECRSTPQFASVGQNYAAQMASDDYQAGTNKMNFDDWVGEITQIADPKNMQSRFRGGSWGHFTQVVWAKSYKVGCGSVHFVNDSWKTSVDICNYAPSGNVQSLPMYEEGDPASKCPTGTFQSKQYPNLCAGSQTISNEQSSVPGAVGEGTIGSASASGGNEGADNPGEVNDPGPGNEIDLSNEGSGVRSKSSLVGSYIHVIRINPNQQDLGDSTTEDVSGNRSHKKKVTPDNRHTHSKDVHDHHPNNQPSCSVARQASEKPHEQEPCKTPKPTKEHSKHKHERKSTAAALSEVNPSLTLLIILFLGSLETLHWC